LLRDHYIRDAYFKEKKKVPNPGKRKINVIIFLSQCIEHF